MKTYPGYMLILLLLAAMPGSQGYGQSPTVQGKWKIAWTYHITNGEKSEGSPPLMDAYWTFGADGRYRIQASVEETGAYKLPGTGVLRMDADRPLTPDFDIRDYGIEKLTADSLILSFPILVTESFSMVNYTILTREK